MAAANASARGQRAAILASPLHELTGSYLAVDCLAPGCHGERSFAVAELASFYGRDGTVGQVLRRMRCSGACGGRVGAAWLVNGTGSSTRVSGRDGCRCLGRRRGSRCAQAMHSPSRPTAARPGRADRARQNGAPAAFNAASTIASTWHRSSCQACVAGVMQCPRGYTMTQPWHCGG
jgi:hypothetical protein